MAKSWIPGANNEMLIVKRGDIIETIAGDRITFIEMKRTKWVGKEGSRNVLVPLYRDRMGTTPYAVKIDGFDNSVNAAIIAPTKMKLGDLFAIVGKREVYMFNCIEKGKIKAVGVSDDTRWTIDPSFDLRIIDIKKVKEKVING